LTLIFSLRHPHLMRPRQGKYGEQNPPRSYSAS
jgi:hypothetical protein